MLNKPIISAIICTYNRANLLYGAVESLVRQTLNKNLYEIIIVDNASTDRTKEVVKIFQDKYPKHRISYVYEDRIGLSHARNSGLGKAAGKYIAYIDDDCRVPNLWLATALRIIRYRKPHVFGGPYYALYNSPKPEWYKDSYGSNIQGIKPKKLKANEYLDGTNIFFKRDLVIKLGGFKADLGMKGNIIGYGEETEIIERIRRTIPRPLILYIPELYVYHLVLPQKMTIKWAIYSKLVSGYYSHLIANSGAHKSQYTLPFKFLWATLRLIKDFIRCFYFSDRNKYQFWQNYFYEETLKHIAHIGYLYAQLIEAQKN